MYNIQRSDVVCYCCMVMEGAMKYCITLQVNGKVSQKVYCGVDPITYIAGYLQAMLDHNDNVVLDDVAIRRIDDN